MTQITSRLATFGLALILIGIPVPGQANEGAMDDTFIDIEDQKLVAEKLHYLWNTEAVYGQSQAPNEAPTLSGRAQRLPMRRRSSSSKRMSSTSGTTRS